MKTNTKTLIIIGSILVVGAVSFVIYKQLTGKKEKEAMLKSEGLKQDKIKANNKASGQKEDSLVLDVVYVDWINKKVSFKVSANGKIIISEMIAWEKTNLGGEFGFVPASNNASTQTKNEVYGAYLPNGLVLVAKSLGVNKSGKIIGFNPKSIKEYNGANLVKDIAMANDVAKSIMTGMFV